MTTIGSGIAGSIAATNLSSHVQAQATQAEQGEETAQAKLLHQLADDQRHQVENSDQAEMDIRPEDSRQGGRRRKGKSPGPAEVESEDLVELTSANPEPPGPAAQLPAQSTAPPAGPKPPSPADSPAARATATPTGGLLDVEA